VGGVDWGYRAAGALQVWGVTDGRRAFLLAEWYRRERGREWWADRIADAYGEFHGPATPFKLVAADSEDPDAINTANTRLSRRGMSKIVRPFRKGKGSIEEGINLLRDSLAPDETGAPSIYIVDGSLRDKDEDLAEEGLPTCLREEIYGLVYPKDVEGKPIKEVPDPGCADHAVDTARYTLWEIWGRPDTKEPEPEFGPNSMAAIDGYAQIMKKARRQGQGPVFLGRNNTRRRR
jgi:hypothetical protein